MKSKNREPFWPSYVDVMTTLFAIMIVLFGVSYSQFRIKEAELKKIVNKYEEIQAIYKVVENIDSTYFEFNPKYVKHIFKIQVTYQKGKFILDQLQEDLFNEEAAIAKREQIIAAGKEIEKTIHKLQDTTFTKQDIKYLVVIEGQASADGYHIDDYFNNDVLSYQRALALHRFWKQEAGIDFSKMDKCELVISGSGEGGMPRISLGDYMARDEYQSKVKNNQNVVIRTEDYEKYNQRFLIHIVPVIGNIKMNE